MAKLYHFAIIALISILGESFTNDAMAVDASVQDDVVTTPFNTPIKIPFLNNDSGDWVDWFFTQGTSGIVTGVSGPELLYTPSIDFVGTDTFTYVLTDSGSMVLEAEVIVTVDPTGPGDATLPTFTCSSMDEICNVTQVAGLGGDLSYGRGAAFVDIDGDGWDDIFAADTDGRFDPNGFGVSKFYLNQGNGTFQSIDVGLNENDLFANWLGSFADYDNDGDPDMLIANGGYTTKSSLAFYVNEMNTSGIFVSATEAALGIATDNQELRNWWGASWADYDNDGFIDLVVTQTSGRPLLYHNDGGAGFSEVGVEIGIDIEFVNSTVFENGKNPVWIDYDNDGDPDLYIAGMHKHAFYQNNGGTSFVNVTTQVFSSFPPNVNSPVGSPFVQATAAEDFNQDGWDDLYLGRWDEQDLVLINDRKGRFLHFGQQAGLDALNTQWNNITEPYEDTMGLGVGDFSNNGLPDIFIGTGNPHRADSDILYCNKISGGFERCTNLMTATADKVYRTRAHGTIFGDVDHDGNTDMYVTLGGHPEDIIPIYDTRQQNALWVRPNSQAKTATLTLEGTTTNRDAIGAKVKVIAGTDTNYYAVRSTQGFQSQNSKALIITLGDNTSANVEVSWPSGATTQLTLSVGQRVHVRENM